jgi:hypothetical protein
VTHSKCAQHPLKDANVTCSRCGMPLCEQCALSAGKEGYKCIGCAGVGAAEKLEARQEERAERRTEFKAKKKKPLKLRYTIGWSLAALIIVLNVIVYLKASIPASEPLMPAEHPIPTIFILDQAIREYAADHEQEVPPSLEAVLGEYIPPVAMSADDLRHFSYRKKSRYTYELRAAPSNTQSGPKLVLTEEGVGE